MTQTSGDDRWAAHGFDAQNAARWSARGFDVADAAPWVHHRVDPDTARAWEQAGFAGGDLPGRAALWYHNGFTPAQALNWGALPGKRPGAWVFAPSIATLFRDAGFTPAQAWPWWRRGFTASLAEKWRDAGVSAAVAERWINSGIDNPDIAASWIDAGATPAEAALYLRACPDTDEALEWRDQGFDQGFDAGSISAWVAAGFTADDAPDWAARWIQPAEARAWRAAGFCAVEAFMWRAQRVEPAAARAGVARGLRDPFDGGTRTGRARVGCCAGDQPQPVDLPVLHQRQPMRVRISRPTSNRSHHDMLTSQVRGQPSDVRAAPRPLSARDALLGSRR